MLFRSIVLEKTEPASKNETTPSGYMKLQPGTASRSKQITFNSAFRRLCSHSPSLAPSTISLIAEPSLMFKLYTFNSTFISHIAFTGCIILNLVSLTIGVNGCEIMVPDRGQAQIFEYPGTYPTASRRDLPTQRCAVDGAVAFELLALGNYGAGA